MMAALDRSLSALDFALARLGSLQSVPIVLAGPPDPVKTVLAAALRRAGADLREEVSKGPAYVLGADGDDLAGHLGATSRAHPIAQGLPLVDLSQSALMRLAHDQIGIGQASVMALLDITNLQLAGRRVVVCGYGPSGASVAAHGAALGGRVCVVERDAVRGAQALAAGHDVAGFAAALPQAEVVFETDDGPNLSLSQIPDLPRGVLLCVAGAGTLISKDIIASATSVRPVRDHVDILDLPQGAEVKLIARGQPLHLSQGQGLPQEAGDIVWALHVLGLKQLLERAPWPPIPNTGPIPLDPGAEAALAAHVVALRGGALQA